MNLIDLNLWKKVHQGWTSATLNQQGMSPRQSESSPFTHVHHPPPTISQSKHLINEPNPNPSILMAKASPGHPLRPDPNGISLSPCFSHSKPSNLSGLNFLGSSQTLGSFCTAHRLRSSIVPRGIRKPPATQSSDDSWGIMGPAGYMRSVSFMMDWRYGSWFRSDSSSCGLVDCPSPFVLS